MKPTFFSRVRIPLFLLSAVIVITLAASATPVTGGFLSSLFAGCDTIPSGASKNKSDFDAALIELDKARMELEKQDIEKHIAETTKQINLQQIQADVDKAMLETKAAMKNIDMVAIKKEVETAIAKIDMAKLNEEISLATANIQPEIKKSLADAKVQIEKAKIQINKARLEMKDYKALTEGLEKDGYINKNEHYMIEHKNGTLIINGKEIPKPVYKKYSSLLQKKGNFSIRKDNGNMNINSD